MQPTLPDWSQIDTVLLDMDGTLLDLQFDNYFWTELVPLRFGEARGMRFEHAVEELAPRFAARRGSLEWYCTDHWSRELGLDIAGLKHEARTHIRFLTGAEEFLVRVRESGRRLMLITNAHHDALRIKSMHTGLGRYFDVLLSSHGFGLPKEHPEFWPRLGQQHSFERGRALFVDDSPPVLLAARSYGIGQVFAITRPDSSQPERVVEGFPGVERVADLLPG